MAPINVLVAGGSGDVGSSIVRALAKDADYQVTVLTRVDSPSQRLEELRALHIPVITVPDYTNHHILVDALQGIDIVVVAIKAAHLLAPQLALVSAAKEAGVRRFVPSEYGIDTSRVTSPIKANNRRVQQAIREAGLEYTFYYNGYFYHYVTGAAFGIDIPRGQARIVGTGDTPLTVTDVVDVGRFVAATLKQPCSRNASLYMQGDRVTFNEVVRKVDASTGRPLQVIPVSPDEVHRAIERDGLRAHHGDAFLALADEGQALLTEQHNHLAPQLTFNSFDAFVSEIHVPA